MIVNEKNYVITAREATSLVMLKSNWVEDNFTLSFHEKEQITINLKDVIERNDERELT